MATMQQQGRARAVLDRLWMIQAEQQLNDAALARLLRVAQSNVSRAKRENGRGVSVRFLLSACDQFPELVFLLFPELRKNMHGERGYMNEGAA
jgi:hypothetical protein